MTPAIIAVSIAGALALITWRALVFVERIGPAVFDDRMSDEAKAELEHASKLDERARSFELNGLICTAEGLREAAEDARRRAQKLMR